MVGITQKAWIRTKSIYLRITLTKTIVAFFLFTFAHCFLHSIVQGFLYTMDWNANALTSAVVSVAQVPKNEFAWLTRSEDSDGSNNFQLQLCQSVPMEKTRENDNSCITVFQGSGNGPAGVIAIPADFRRREIIHGLSRRQDANNSLATVNVTEVPSIGVTLSPNFDPLTGVISSVQFQQANVNGGNPKNLSAQCTRVVMYADQVLANSKREEIALVGSEFWILAISVFAIVYGSISHLIAAYSLRLLSTAWSGYSIWRTNDIHLRFKVLLEGVCGVDFFPGYFNARMMIQYGDLGLNILTTLLTAYFLVRMVRTYSSFVFQCIGPPDHIIKIYRLSLSLLACLQISVYVLIVSSFLWADQLIEGAIASISSHTPIYIFLVIATLVLLPPWLIIGWRALRREQRRSFIAFISVGVLLEAGWSAMYYSLVWRWTWIQWPFFACLAVASQAALLACVVIGAICRYNFGKGLKEYLRAADALEKEDFEPEVFSPGSSKGRDIEKGSEDDFDRLSHTLDFGAHQPVPPLSPPMKDPGQFVNVPPPPAPLQQHSGFATWIRPLSKLAPAPRRPPRPQTFSMISSIPSLGKSDPWKAGESPEEKAEWERIRV